MKLLRLLLLLFIMACIVTGCNFKINKTIDIYDGETVHSSQNTVNGNIFIGHDCEVRGECRTVNGRIEVGDNSKVEKLQAVNGTITLRREVIVRDDVESVNGSVDCDQGVRIYGGINTVNGSIALQNTSIRRDITTYNGNVELLDKSYVQGDIVVKKSKGSSGRRRRLKIYVTDESVVEGDVIVKDRYLDVAVVLSHGGTVKGRIRNAEIIEE